MKYAIMGISQQRALELGLDLTDIAIYAWFRSMVASNPKSVRVDGKVFYWLNYNTLLDDMPVVSIKKRTLRDRLKKMEDAGILTHFTEKGPEGTFSYYGFGDNAYELEYNPPAKNSVPRTQKTAYPRTQKITDQRTIYSNKPISIAEQLKQMISHDE